MIYFLDDLNMP
jgi:dynein heavy chain, axonemal